MKISVKYQSIGGNTRAVAEVIATALGIEAKPIDVQADGYTDILFIGCGTYKWDAPVIPKEYLKGITPGSVGKVALFSTSSFQSIALRKLEECARSVGLRVSRRKLLLRMGWKGHSSLGQTGGKLSNGQKTKICKFAKLVMTEPLADSPSAFVVLSTEQKIKKWLTSPK